MKKVDKDWGYEEWIINNELYCFKKLFIKKNYCCSIHWHKNKDETFYIEDGNIKLEIFGKDPIILQKNSIYRLHPNTLHRFTGIEDTMMYEVSTHHEDLDSYRVIKGGKIESCIS